MADIIYFDQKYDLLKHYKPVKQNPQQKHQNINKIIQNISDTTKPKDIIFVTGSKGKTSTAEFISQQLNNVSLFTSPHQISYTERIRINNKEISDQDIVISLKLCEQIQKKLNIKLSFFEKLLVAYILQSKLNKSQIYIIEPGIGGYNDSTYPLKYYSKNVNVVLTSIELEHENVLGKQLENIALNKLKLLNQNSKLFTNKKLYDDLLKNVLEQNDFTNQVFLSQNYEDKIKQNQEIAKLLLKELNVNINKQNINKQQINKNIFYSKAHTVDSMKQTLYELEQQNFIPDLIIYSQTKKRDSGQQNLKILINKYPKSKIIIIPCPFSLDLRKSLKIDKQSYKVCKELYNKIKDQYQNRIKFITDYKNLKFKNEKVLVTGSSHLPALIQVSHLN